MPKMILLADDDADDAEIFQEALHDADPSAGFYREETGAGIFRYLNDPENTRPDIIFLDLNMPVMNGWQCLAKLKNISDFEPIPVVMYTTSSNPRDYEIARDLNAHGLITKPSYPKVLRSVLEIIIPKLNTSQLKQAVKEAYVMAKEYKPLPGF
jgi:CheY-like chemotaxis protein